MPAPETRTRLVLTAMQLFWEKGYGSTSVADVLKAAKVNSGSLYHFFPGKQDLLLAVLDGYYDGISPMLLEPAWHGVTDPLERVFALLAAYRRALEQTECGYGCPIGSLAGLRSRALPVASALLVPMRALTLNPPAFGDAAQAPRVDVGEALAQLGRVRPFDAPRHAMHAAVRIDRDEVAPVAARENPSLVL